MNELLGELMKDSYDFINGVSAMTKTVSDNVPNGETAAILAYPLLSKGHMLRPFLVFLTTLAVSPRSVETLNGDVVAFAAVIELLHTASLVHDDLIDREETRRGKPSLYKKYGTNNAVLAGNCYYIRALQLSNERLGPKITAEVLRTAFLMCTGELLQAQYENLLMPESVYFEIIRAKTAGLAALACKGAALIMNAGNAGVWEAIGEKIGLIYQLRDDAKDKDVRLRQGFDYEDVIAKLTLEAEALLEETGCADKNRKFTDLIRLF